MEDVTKAVEEISANVKELLSEEITPIRERLLSLEERNTEPNDEKVKDLEAKLAEAEGSIATMQEDVRRVQIEAGKVRAPKTKEERLAGDAKTVFKAMFGVEYETVVKLMRANGGHLPSPDEARGMGGIETLAGVDTSLFGTGGKLPIDVLDSFLDYGVDETATLRLVNRQPMVSDSMRLDRMHASKRSLRLGVEQTEPTSIGNITTPSRNLNVKEAILPEDISLDWLENNIERAGGEQAVVSRLSRQFLNDHDDLLWNGDENAGAGPDQDFLTVNDGIFVIAAGDSDVNDYDATGISTAKEGLNAALRKLPGRYRTAPGLTFFLSVGFVQTYADEVAARETAGGDTVLVGGFPAVRYFGIPLIPESNIDGASGNGWLGPRQDLAWGVQRDVRIDNEWKPRKRQVEYTITAKTDQNYGFGGVHVYLQNIPAGLSG